MGSYNRISHHVLSPGMFAVELGFYVCTPGKDYSKVRRRFENFLVIHASSHALAVQLV